MLSLMLSLTVRSPKRCFPFAGLGLTALGALGCSLVISPSELVARDPRAQPFLASSIWNLPLGAQAVYVPARIPAPTAGLMDLQAVIILEPDAPPTPIHFSNDAWSGRSRCDVSGKILSRVPLPRSFVVPGATPDHQPSSPAAILLADGVTLKQNQPLARCQPGSDATTLVEADDVSIDGPGISGSHGGSALSALGGTIRLGEWVPGGEILHALKLGLDPETSISSTAPGFRFPALRADDTYQQSYHGKVAALKMGALLALPPSFVVDQAGGLETEPARVLARALQNYGAYLVNMMGDVSIVTELSPRGSVADEFAKGFGFSFGDSAPNSPWARDVARVVAALAVVDNWNESEYQRVAASAGREGVGGGPPRVPWALPLSVK